MHPPRFRLACALVVAVALSTPGVALGQAQIPEPTGPDFQGLLLADAKVTPAVKRALRAKAAVAEPAAFADLTADGVSDATVLVSLPGAAGAIAAYVVSAQGSPNGDLRVIYRSQGLYRAVARASRGTLVILTPDYARGDDVCCPSARRERSYVFDRRNRGFRRTASRRLTRAAPTGRPPGVA